MDDTEFIRALRSALNNLYEPDQLRGNPLVAVLRLEGRVDAPAALYEILVDAIDGIRESGDETNAARAWLAYDTLHFRYVRGYAREDVARKLNISDRQFSRELRTAIESLATHIWRKYQLSPPAARAETSLFTGATQTLHAADNSAREEPERSELVTNSPFAAEEGADWLQDMPVENPSGWRDILDSVLTLLQPVMAQHNTRLLVTVEHPLPDLLVAQNTLRQSLLVLLGWLIPAASGGVILLKPEIAADALLLRWEVTLRDGKAGVLREEVEQALAIPHHLLAHRGGSLVVETTHTGATHTGAPSLLILLTIPALAQIPILAIDDNLDTIQLFQRYVQGTRYALVGVSNPDDLEHTLERVQPRIILLDVMMPRIDGWDMLARLRQLPDAEDRAIIVCSIMPLESVARSLGATGFLQKPLLPQQLLQALDAQLGLRTP